MPEIWQALSYDVVAARIWSTLLGSQDLVLVQGPPGTGKSWLAAAIGAAWEDEGGSTVVAHGDFAYADASLWPFGFAMAGLGAGWRKTLPKLKGVTRAGEMLLGTGGLVTASVEALAKARKTRKRGRKIPLDDGEQDVLHDLERLSRTGSLLLIADNLHWWDARSLDLLGRLRDPRMWDAFPFLSEMRVIAVQTPEPYQTVMHPASHARLLDPVATSAVELERVPRDAFAEVLEALGAGASPPADVVDAIYAFSGGHLALASRCAERVARGEGAALVAAADSDEFLRRILVERISALGSRGQQALAMLQIAATLGLTFRIDELTCATGADEPHTARLLRECRSEAVLVVEDGVGRFVHDLYRQYFLSTGALDRTSIHEKLAECLRILRPGDYELRASNAIRADRPREGAAWAVHAALQRQRDGLSWRDLRDAMGDFEPVAEGCERALAFLNEYRFQECLETLAGLPRNLTKSLMAEVDHLRATCLMVTRSEDDRAAARALVEAWIDYEDEEPELWIRLMQLLLYALAMLVDKEPGLRLEARVRKVLAARTAFDPAAEDALYTLERCAGRFHLPERAVLLGRDAVAHFGPNEGQTLVRRPVEYYRCLVNLGANLTANARFAEAHEVHAELERLVASYPSGVFPRLDYPQMNELLAQYRDGTVALDEAIVRQRQIVAEHEVAGDPFWVESALAVYLAIGGNEAEATAILDGLERELTVRGDPAPSLLYLVRGNRCAIRFVTGHVEAVDEWRELMGTLVRIPYVTLPYMVRRHQLLEQVMSRGERMTAAEFDECLLAERPLEFGPLWQQLGRGFWMPEIEWWR